jgi:hypothetical protein
MPMDERASYLKVLSYVYRSLPIGYFIPLRGNKPRAAIKRKAVSPNIQAKLDLRLLW